MYYIFLENEKLNGCGECKRLDCENIETTKSIYEDYIKTPNKYIYQDGEIVINPNYEKEEEEKEKEHIKSLTCTKRVFALMLQELGIDYLTQLKPLIKSNPQAQLEWDLCIELLRSNPLLDLMAMQFGITSEQLDRLFQYANGEITLDEFKKGE